MSLLIAIRTSWILIPMGQYGSTCLGKGSSSANCGQKELRSTSQVVDGLAGSHKERDFEYISVVFGAAAIADRPDPSVAVTGIIKAASILRSFESVTGMQKEDASSIAVRWRSDISQTHPLSTPRAFCFGLGVQCAEASVRPAQVGSS
jgi:hypothetical protein